MSVEERQHVLPTEAMARCASAGGLRQVLVSTAPFNELVMAHGDDGSGEGAWKALYIQRYIIIIMNNNKNNK
jgi:hypothetical protein